MGKKQTGENSKKAAGNAKKAEAAAQKAAVDIAKKAAVEDAEWSKGAKSNSKKEAADAKALEAARKKADKDALLAAEEKALASARATPKNAKTAVKKSSSTPAAGAASRGLDLAQLDEGDPSSTAAAAAAAATSLNATGIDNALDALSLTSENAQGGGAKVDRHPERRVKAAYAAFEARRLPEVEGEFPGLRKQQRVEIVRKEFERSGENPFNQLNARFDTSKEDIRGMKEREREKVEERLAG